MSASCLTGFGPRFLLLTTLGLGLSAASARELSLEDRIRAQEAIERVRYAHQEEATLPFEQAVSQDLLRRKVETYLAQSAALESIWNAPVTAVMLERELTRIAARTRMPARLTELFAALDNDPLLIQECLVRPVLVDRLARNAFASDPAIHVESRARALEVRAELSKGTLDPRKEHPSRSLTELRRGVGSEGQHTLARTIDLEPDEFDRWRESAPAQVGEVGPLWDEDETYAVRVVLEEAADRAVVASYTFPKRTWDDWWCEAASRFDVRGVHAVAEDGVEIPTVGATSGFCTGDLWEAGVLEVVPGRRSGHTAVWTGSEMIVWGGNGVNGWQNTGLRYDPTTDSWTATSTTGAPAARMDHTAVWTGQAMIVWGGQPLSEAGETGGRYDPASDSWSPTTLGGAPAPRWLHTAVWTGSAMIVWGGIVPPAGKECNCCYGGNAVGCNDATCESIVCAVDPFCCNVDWDSICSGEAQTLCTCCPGPEDTDSGGRYNPVTNSWTPTSLAGAPTGRSAHTAVWTGTRMVVWGGDSPTLVDTGGRYDPASNSWTPTAAAGAPAARGGHRAVWTGSQMIVWGGKGADHLNTGGRYDVATDSWTPTTPTAAPSARSKHTAVWTGDDMLVWGGVPVDQVGESGGRYDPASDSWLPMSTTAAPLPRKSHTMVWTGSEAIVWGGDSDYANVNFEPYATGGRYDPSSDTWTPTFSSGTPDGREQHTAVWTGNTMIVWGGKRGSLAHFASGGRYDPVLDAWTPTSLAGAPGPRYAHTAVWTGNTMIVWGGDHAPLYAGLDTGGRYDPIGDSWLPTTLAGAPSARYDHTAVWTGSRMIVWGGDSAGGIVFNTGGRYDPVADAWSPTTTTGAPTARTDHTAVWTGSRMIVWGGLAAISNTGGRYDPAADTWSPVSLSGAVPSPRISHSAVWTGNEMIVWGGFFMGYKNTGGRYDPVTDSWIATPLAGAPAPRSRHTAVWTGNHMIVWGGHPSVGPTGGRYDPMTNSWTATPLAGAPAERYWHTAVWTGNHMIVWGGYPNLETGGSYAAEGADADGDGVGCVIDCDDGSAGAFASPGEVSGVRFAADKTELLWNSQSVTAGSGTLYDVVRGALVELPVGAGGSEVCLESDYGPGSDPVVLDDSETPGAGDGFWYLVRATNTCGIGSYGKTSANEERVTTICP